MSYQSKGGDDMKYLKERQRTTCISLSDETYELLQKASFEYEDSISKIVNLCVKEVLRNGNYQKLKEDYDNEV